MNRNKKIVVITLAILAILGVAMAVDKTISKYKLRQATSAEYQAVFLSNGQVYFGKLEKNHYGYVLRDIYYLKTAQNIQPATSEQGSSTPNSSDSQQTLQLVKLGSEVHGPEDAMYIDRDKIMFWENLKSDSKVVQTIKQGR